MRLTRGIVKKYENEKGCKGVLARSLKADGNNFPHTRRPSTQRRYLENYCGASEGNLKAFDECVEEYEREREVY